MITLGGLASSPEDELLVTPEDELLVKLIHPNRLRKTFYSPKHDILLVSKPDVY